MASNPRHPLTKNGARNRDKGLMPYYLIAEEIGGSPEGIRQTEIRALEKLKIELEAQGLTFNDFLTSWRGD